MPSRSQGGAWKRVDKDDTLTAYSTFFVGRIPIGHFVKPITQMAAVVICMSKYAPTTIPEYPVTKIKMSGTKESNRATTAILRYKGIGWAERLATRAKTRIAPRTPRTVLKMI